MSLLSNLSPVSGSTHYRKRIGRGRGSGLGQTSGKGHKGQLARTGGRVRRGFEGGQTPLMRRLPKFGFSNIGFKTSYNIINLSQLEKLSGDITPELLKNLGIISSGMVKVLGNGALSKKINVKAHKVSESARVKIEALGGKVEVIE